MDKGLIRGGESTSHDSGNDILYTVKETGQQVLIEGDEYHLCKAALMNNEIHEYKNKTNKEILEDIYTRSSCMVKEGEANVGDFIICKLAVRDKEKRNLTGTIAEIVSIMQKEHGCRVVDGAEYEKMKKGGKVGKQFIAPNGKRSNLLGIKAEDENGEWIYLYDIVRTPKFKEWFGDWEDAYKTKDYDDVSKIIDENGEPLICVHNTPNEFFEFDEYRIGTTTDSGYYGKGFYFFPSVGSSKYGEIELNCFLSIKNPYFKQSSHRVYELNSNELKNKGYDGVVVYSSFVENISFENGVDRSEEIVAYYSTQIKIADGTNTTFDKYNPDIRFKKGGSLSKTPAPKKERIYGSKTNPKGTSATGDTAKSIKFSESTLETIKNKVDEHNQKHPDKKITLATAKAVVRRGMGAYSSTHRPTIKGGKPNSRVAWGLARLNAFLYKAVNGKSKSGKYSQDNDLLDELGIKHSNLEMGGIFHGSPYEFEKFTTEKIGTGEGSQAFGWGLYFTDLESIARSYAKPSIDNEFVLNGVNLTGKIPYNLLVDLNTLIQFRDKPELFYGVEKNFEKRTIESLRKYAVESNNEELYNAFRYIDSFNDLKFNRNFYKVTLHKGKSPDQYTWLEWDKPLTSEQIDKIKKQAEKEDYKGRVSFKNGKIFYTIGNLTDEITNGRDLYRAFAGDWGSLKKFSDSESFTEKETSLFLLRAGIDGIKYPAESISMGVTSDTARGFNYVVFDENAVTIESKEKFNKGGNINYGKNKKSKEIKDLIVLHNINENQIKQANKLGGLVTPSIAIIKSGNSYTDFGSITLVGTKELIDPQNSSVKVFAGDVYSPSVPRKLYYVDNRLLDKVTNELIKKAYKYDESISNSDREIYNIVQQVIGSYSDFYKDINTLDFNTLIENYYEKLKLVYIVDKSIKLKVPMKEKRHFLWNNVEFTLTEEQKKRFAPILREYTKESNEKGSIGISNEIKSKVYDLFLEVLNKIKLDIYNKYKNEENGDLIYNLMTDGLDESFEKYVGKRDDWHGHAEYKLSKAVWGEQELDKEKFNKNIKKVFTKSITEDYKKWISDFISQFQGSAYFLKGNEKMPYTLSNLVDATSTRIVGQEKNMTFGVNQAKSFATKRLNSIDEIKKNSDKIITKEEMNLIDEKNKEKFFKLSESLNHGYDTWSKLDSLGKALADYFKGSSIFSALTKNDFKSPSSYQIELFREFADELKNSPVDYFEAKYQRAVSLKEFKYAIVPKNTSKEVIQILNENGLIVKKYETNEKRLEIINNISQKDKSIKFAKGGSVLLAPNGKPSNLTPEQYKLVRTPEFKAWFGDWQNSPETASKVVDENGEPLVVYHGTFRPFNIFEVSKDGGFYFTEFKRIAELYSLYIKEGKTHESINDNPIVLSCFLNIRKISIETIYGIVGRNLGRINKAKNKRYDGLLLKGGRDYGGYYDQFIAFESNQIKLADGTNTTFDGNNPDIRFKKGGLFDRDTMAGGHQYTVFFDLNGRRTSRKVFANTKSSAESWIKFQYPEAKNISSRKEY